MIRRLPFASLLIGAAALPAAAAVAPGFNPNEVQADARRSIFDARTFAACLATWPPGRDVAGLDDPFADCRCAVDLYMAGRETAELEPVEAGNAKARLGPILAQCRTARVAGVKPPPVVAAAPIEPAPSPAGDDAAERPRAEAEGAKPETGGPLARIALPRLPGGWLTALPIAAMLLILIVIAFRRRRERGDLVGPPESMRADAPPAPPPSTPAPPNPNWPQ